MQQADFGAGRTTMTAKATNPPTTGGDAHTVTGAAAANAAAANPLPKCFCNWKHCWTYQKALQEYKHTLMYNGVIKLKFVKMDRKSLALKAAVDRTLHVESGKRNKWKTVDSAATCRYYVARHHFTEALMKQYLANCRAWDWREEPLSMKQAKTFLWSLDCQDDYHSEEEAEQDDNDDAPSRYVQSPNVPKELVREMLKKIKDDFKKQQQSGSSAPSNQNNNNNHN
jgi:hypothetical protein